MMFHRMNICSVVPLFCLNPACSFRSRLSTPFFSLLNTLLITGSNVIPLQLLQSRKSPFLKILIISPCFHKSGQVSVSQSLLNSLCSLLVVSSMSAFSNSGPTWSTPAALPFRVFFNAVLTSSASPLKPLNEIQRNLTGSKISTSSTKFVFFGPIRKTRWPPWPLIG